MVQRRRLLSVTCAAAFALIGTTAFAQAPAPAPAPAAPAAAPAPAPLPQLGTIITLAQAKQAAAAAFAEAAKNNWIVAVSIFDMTGQLVYFERADGTQYGSIQVSQDKGRSAALFRRPTTAFATPINAGNPGLLTLAGANAVEGGHPILSGGKLIGSIGVSGVTSAQDGVVARAGAAAIN
jgi:glc operon protein GlcG